MAMELNIDSAVSQLTTIGDWLRWTTSRFYEGEIALGHGSDSYWDEAVFLVLQALHLPPESDGRLLEAKLTMPERYRVAEWVQRRVVNREPLAYITQTAWQQGVEFYVDQRVLIPRSPIGNLLAEGFENWMSAEPSRILDMCTGSGCLAILSAMAYPQSHVDAVDISADALTLASFNIGKHGLEDRVRLVQSDGLAQIPEGLQYDLIVCNPPYVDAGEMANLPPEFRFEPALALESGDDGLDFVRNFLSQVHHYMSDTGILVLEVGYSWRALEEACPGFNFTWLEVEGGAVGMTLINKADALEISGIIGAAKQASEETESE
ncbi:MAG: 50S ribosomal protein L3 N(5)-glutamine methyltransferase [Pseudomonadota bacterium]|nr:50S ribosomal protein L3 N(5)-glutamine methyltransferase [Pseudomonadota bacterium]